MLTGDMDRFFFPDRLNVEISPNNGYIGTHILYMQWKILPWICSWLYFYKLQGMQMRKLANNTQSHLGQGVVTSRDSNPKQALKY